MPAEVFPGSLFLSTPSARRATRAGRHSGRLPAISIHALREEGDRPQLADRGAGGNFYPRPPRGGRLVIALVDVVGEDFYPRPPRGGRPCNPFWKPLPVEFLSTPSARRATHPATASAGSWPISIHALREEGDKACCRSAYCSRLFLSTPSARRATFNYEGKLRDFLISIHALREEGDGAVTMPPVASCDFYPRPPRGGRPGYNAGLVRDAQFLSTPSARRATRYDRAGLHRLRISIHALREEGDSLPSTIRKSSANFYPRPPRGGRQWRRYCPPGWRYFYPRPPRGGRQVTFGVALRLGCISIHALREEGDLRESRHRPRLQNFYPRPPRGGRRTPKT